MSKLDAALALAKRGFKIFPIAPNAKFPPLWNNWPLRATNDAKALQNWPQDANIGVHCEGLLVLDVDTRKGGDEGLTYLRTAYDLPETLTTITPSGGKHLFYRLPAGHPGVPNSVERIGKGIDVRSTGGYVVAPGSETPAGRYRFEREAEIAPAPDWLVLKAGAIVPKTGTNEPVPDAPEAVVERARQWLLTAPRSVKGQGGDQTAYIVACTLRDMGVSEQQAVELMRSEAWDYGCGWRGGHLEDKPIRSAFRYAQNEPGAKAALPEDFPVHDSAPASSGVQAKLEDDYGFTDKAKIDAGMEPAAGSGIYALKDVESRRNGRNKYLIRGLLYRRSFVNLYGAPGQGKTFVALDMCYHVAAGRPWMGRKTRRGTVVYLPFEGKGGLVDRLLALRAKYGHGDVPFFIADNPSFNIRTKEGRQALGGLLARLPGGRPDLVVIDTFAYALSGGDENSAQDVGTFSHAIQQLVAATGACVVVVHHTGKNKAAGARGSSALQAAVDSEIFVDEGTVVATKQRDEAVGEPIGFRLRSVVVGLDEDGDELTSCTVDADEINAGPKVGRITGNAKRGFDVLCELRPTNDPITDVEWKEACRDFLGDRDVNKRFWDIKKVLMRKGYVEIDEQGMVTRRCE